MKTIRAFIAATLAVVLVLSPIMAFAAAGSITFSSPAAGSSYKGNQSYAIAGTVSPAPGVVDNVFITVKNPGGNVVDANSVTADPTTGAFTYSTATGGSAYWTSGTYTISATDSYGATGTTSFTYTAATTAAASGAFLEVQVAAASPVYAGQAEQIDALVVLSNGSTPSNLAVSAHYHDPSGTAVVLNSPTLIHSGMYQWTITIPSTAQDGLYDVMVFANSSSFSAWGSAGFTVNSQIASSSSLNSLSKNIVGNLTAISTALASLTTQTNVIGTAVNSVSSQVASDHTAIAAIQSTVSTLSTSLNTITSDLNTLSTTVTSLQTSVSGLSGLSQQVTNLSSQVSNVNSAVSSDQTYVLVVAALAAITLVLELAILVRKLS